MGFTSRSMVIIAAVAALIGAGRAAGEPHAQGVPANSFCPMLGLIISDARLIAGRGLGAAEQIRCESVAQTWLATLRRDLGITPDQSGAFGSFADVLLSEARKAQSSYEATASAVSGPLSPEEKIDWRARLMKARFQAFTAIRPALTALYAKFDDAQKHRANQLVVPAAAAVNSARAVADR